MLRWSMARKFIKCLTEGIVSYIADEGWACDHHVSYNGQRWDNVWHGYPNDDKLSHPAAQYNKGRFKTTAGQPKVEICKAHMFAIYSQVISSFVGLVGPNSSHAVMGDPNPRKSNNRTHGWRLRWQVRDEKATSTKRRFCLKGERFIL